MIRNLKGVNKDHYHDFKLDEDIKYKTSGRIMKYEKQKM